jgi:integrase
MSVTLRKKTIGKGRKSLYLDFYPAIPHPDTRQFTRREFLGLYIYARPQTGLEQTHNKETLLLAENICAKRTLEVQNAAYGFLGKAQREGKFLDHFKKVAAKKSGSNAWGWEMGWRYFESYAGKHIRFCDITESFCEEYRDYILSGPSVGRNGRRISLNTAVAYFAKFRSMLKGAYKAKLLTENLYETIKPIKEREVFREFLTLEELQQLAATPNDDDLMARAALFSAMTGLRYSDIETLLWSEVRGHEDNYYVQFRQEKTEGAETFPVSNEAHRQLGIRGESDSRVFRGIRYSRLKPFLTLWLTRAGIPKTNFTFHCLRHTFATLQLILGTDIHTVMRMLGQKSLKSTQRYLHLLDKVKKEASGKISLSNKTLSEVNIMDLLMKELKEINQKLGTVSP